MKARVFGMAATFALAGCLALAGCSSGSTDDSQEATTSGDEQSATQEEETVQSDYEVSIDDCVVTEDYEGNSAIVVTFTWTNNSEDNQMFEVAIDATAFQNGIELDYATISVTNEEFDTNSAYNEIKPGTTQTVQQAFLLDDQSEVTVECTEFISLDDTLLAEATFSLA